MRNRARRLRREQTEAEKKLWTCLRSRQLSGAKFRRQYPIGPFIVDFCYLEHSLVVELDGGQQTLQKERDRVRTKFLEQRGYRVLRFWDHEALSQTNAVLERILQTIGSPSPPPSPLRGKGGGH